MVVVCFPFGFCGFVYTTHGGPNQRKKEERLDERLPALFRELSPEHPGSGTFLPELVPEIHRTLTHQSQ